MRKLTIVLSLAALAASSGCTNCCIGRCRNLFHKGSPCGTTVAPAVLGAPLAMGTPLAQPVAAPFAYQQQPMMTAPTMAPQVYVEQPEMCYPCPPCNPCIDPCADPCSGAMSMGYMGGYTSDGACCGDGATMAPMQMAPMQSGATYTLPPGAITPSPGTDQ